MNAKAVVPLIAGLGIAGLAAKLGLDYVKRAQGSAPKTVQVWSVNMDVPRGSTIDEVNLKQLNFPLEFVPKGAFTDTKQLIGRVPHTGVPADVPVLESMLLPPGTKPGIHVPTGFRAIAVKIDDGSGVDNHLDPGCHVDVVGYFQIKNPTNGKQETIARTIVENVQVAAVGQRLAPEAPRVCGSALFGR
ncbi:MAG: Flp pilus assembly protein CpaB [Planctomycetes bacterium]|nr:Flp pilus assembly protein CpaB [Planctomycetota bacterium]